MSSITSLGTNLKTLKDSSLLYQVLNSLLFSSGQGQPSPGGITHPEEQPVSSKQCNGLQQTEFHHPEMCISLENFRLKMTSSPLDCLQKQLILRLPTGNIVLDIPLLHRSNISLPVEFDLTDRKTNPGIYTFQHKFLCAKGIEQWAVFKQTGYAIDNIRISIFTRVELTACEPALADAATMFEQQAGVINGSAYLNPLLDKRKTQPGANEQMFNSLLMVRLASSRQFINHLADTDINTIIPPPEEQESGDKNEDRIVQLSRYQRSI